MNTTTTIPVSCVELAKRMIASNDYDDRDDCNILGLIADETVIDSELDEFEQALGFDYNDHFDLAVWYLVKAIDKYDGEFHNASMQEKYIKLASMHFEMA